MLHRYILYCGWWRHGASRCCRSERICIDCLGAMSVDYPEVLAFNESISCAFAGGDEMECCHVVRILRMS